MVSANDFRFFFEIPPECDFLKFFIAIEAEKDWDKVGQEDMIMDVLLLVLLDLSRSCNKDKLCCKRLVAL